MVEDNYYPTTDSDTAVENEQYNQLLVAAAAAAAVASNEQWSENLSSVEDLTSEVQELMMRYRKKNFFLICLLIVKL